MICCSKPNIHHCSVELWQQLTLQWYQLHGRHDLPWQQHITPYRVWVSETMLQQTQVQTVIPYFERFMQRFADVEALANASDDDVMQLWAGLGYYSRARNLHRCAQIITEHYAGQFPHDVAQLQQLPGIGRSTAGAIAAIAFNKQAAILDGNVKRVLSRAFAIAGWSGHTAVSKQLWDIAEQLTPNQQVGDYTQAMMDLGATVCTRKQPQCLRCPLNQLCQAYQSQRVAEFPSAKPKKNKPTQSRYFLILRNNDERVLLEKRANKGIWGGLWSFPEWAEENTGEALQQYLLQDYGLQIIAIEMLATFKHTFSHYHLTIKPLLCDVEIIAEHKNKQRHWQPLCESAKLGLPRPVQMLWDDHLFIKNKKSNYLPPK